MQSSVSHYRILEKIGAGGMGVVYRAHDEHLDCDVALKLLLEGELADQASRKRFRKEALTLSKLNHPNIAIIHDFDSQDGVDFLVQELIPGLALSDMVSSGPLPEREIVNLGAQLAEGLAAAHEHGIIHRDLKPANIRVTPDGRLKVLDFGLAQITKPTSSSLTTASETERPAFGGTLAYMAPEQLLNEKLDARADIWAAGCVLYEMATGRHPFSGDGPPLIDAILHHPPVIPHRLNPYLSEGIAAIILKCLEKDPSLRYFTARDLAVDLHRLSAGSSASVIATKPRRRLRRMLAVTGTLVLLAIASAGFYSFARRNGASAPLATTSPSIAVLPFVDLSSEKDQEYFADGLAEELLNSLARTPGLLVAGRTSSFQFKGKNTNLADIGRQLKVGTILEGSVRKHDNRVRITAQLINAADGFHLWSETYDRELNDIFKVQEDIAQSVAASLKVTLLGGRTSSLRGTNEQAYNAYLQARYFHLKSSKENLQKAVEHYESAVQLDPKYALAWAGLAEALSRQADWAYVPVAEAYPKARAAADKALALEPDLAEAHAASGWISMNYGWDWAAADSSFQRALSLESGNATVLYGASVLAANMGRREEAAEIARRFVAVDPLNTQAYVTLAGPAYSSGRYEEAIAALNKAVELDPERQYVHTFLVQIYVMQSHPEQALAEAEKEADPSFRLYARALALHALARKKESDTALSELIAKYHSGLAYQIAEVYAFRGDNDRTFEWLERAYRQRDGGLSNILADPLFTNVMHDQRYDSLLKKIGLPRTN